MPLKIPPDMQDKLENILPKVAYLQISEQMKYKLHRNNMSEGDLYNQLTESNKHKAKTDRNKFHGDFMRAWNLKISAHNPKLFQPALLDRLRMKLGIVPSDSALWLTQLFYQFFLIDMVKYDIIYEYNFKHLNLFELEKPEDILNSFPHFRRGIELLLMRIALPLGMFDHALMSSFDLKSELFNEFNKSQKLLLDIWTTEGFQPYYGDWITKENVQYMQEKYWTYDDSGIFLLTKKYDASPVLSDFFIALFADDAAKILKKNKYSFTRISSNGHRTFNNFLNVETLLDFYEEFLKIVTDKTISLLNDYNSPSSKGWKIYNSLNEVAKNYAIGSIDGIDQNMFKLRELIFFDHKEWINWYYNILNSSKVYTCWRDELNLYRSLISHEELENLFDIR
ncbi:hypothetical protein [Ligilactobacillus salivarius]|uniref:hypothetical protein n=1 Tax=Ligilactobacillus salivarius TaxID=1624 RepID=UPI002103FAC5|nr:hypothetical protein [Ligilactobacillus salivarius]UTX36530.1 hypothetical protein NNL28_07425 [Ligilactobacillus salivarius]